MVGNEARGIDTAALAFCQYCRCSFVWCHMDVYFQVHRAGYTTTGVCVPRAVTPASGAGTVFGGLGWTGARHTLGKSTYAALPSKSLRCEA